MAVALQERVTGVLVFDGEPETLGVTDPGASGGVLVFDGRPTVGAVTHYAPAGITVTATTGPRGAQGVQGIQGDQGDDGLDAFEVAVREGYTGTLQQWLDSLRFFVLVEPGEEPPAGTPDRSFVFEHIV